ncbi:tRNA (adenine(22)-N(1))-methyltransferase TrmK [Catenovulum sp. SM1970]|uniref:tRNA (adenine(22)-N(1))-methyltransferase n=1 Tax=Marinifaba aquimaris TaxID=2741323 RepID=UPI0015739D44|nr:tRNA (adenine(22)-N(1))-methyltransferase TrmK [Marinifaba aquimaris]NTS76012.1 tRNA (adenine(22)-N(1))-methyltransferase TrmK [Marinifaba aquimaris]
MKLSKRLTHIEQVALAHINEYQHIWDTCCDHGYLGASILSKNPQMQVNFVDCVPSLISQIEQNLQKFHPNSNAKTHCVDLKKLDLLQSSMPEEGKHLVIIAGVGGELMSEFISNILLNNQGIAIDFILCPVNYCYHLRESLEHANLGLIDEWLIKENNRFYEILYTSNDSHQHHLLPSKVGEKIWQSDDSKQNLIAKEYLNKLLCHYRKVEFGGQLDAADIVRAYEQVKVCEKR